MSTVLYSHLRRLFPQPSQPLLRIVNFRESGIGVFLELEEFFVVLGGFSFPSYQCFFKHLLPSFNPI